MAFETPIINRIKMTKEISTNVQAIDALEAMFKKSAPILSNVNAGLHDSLVLAATLQNAMDTISNNQQISTTIMSLQGTRIGFKADKQYPQNIVVSCAVEALMQGLRLVGNEFNIIAGNMYVTKEGFTRKLGLLEGFEKFRYSVQPPTVTGEKALAKCSASWVYNGVQYSIGIDKDDECVIPIKTNKYMGDDGIIGKAERKLFSRIYTRITGVAVGDGDAQETGQPARPAPTVINPDQEETVNKLKKPAPKVEIVVEPEPTGEPIVLLIDEAIGQLKACDSVANLSLCWNTNIAGWNAMLDEKEQKALNDAFDAKKKSLK